MRLTGQILSLLVLLPLALAAGCQKPPLLQDVIKKLHPTPPSEMVKMAFDPDDPDRRRQGILQLAKHDWGLKEPYLKGMATLLRSDDDPSVRSAAARALGKAGNAKYLPDLANALNDASASVRWDAAVALDQLPGEEAIKPLQTHALKDESVDVRSACARALRHYRIAEVVRTLKECLDDKDFAVRYRAHASLVKIFRRDFRYGPRNWPDDPPAVRTAKEEKKHTRPWWDWFSVSQRSRRKAGKVDSSGKTHKAQKPNPKAPARKPSRPKDH